MRDQSATVYSRNGTAFFLDVGAGLFAVTAAHVIDCVDNFRVASGALPTLWIAGLRRQSKEKMLPLVVLSSHTVRCGFLNVPHLHRSRRAKARISSEQIESKIGVCKFQDAHPESDRFKAHALCQFPDGRSWVFASRAR